jgi:hypothetical protein
MLARPLVFRVNIFKTFSAVKGNDCKDGCFGNLHTTIAVIWQDLNCLSNPNRDISKIIHHDYHLYPRPLFHYRLKVF